MEKPSTALVMFITGLFSDENVFNYSITHRAANKKHSITVEIKDSFHYDHTQAIKRMYELAELMSYSCYAEEPTTRNTKKYTFAFKTYKGRPPHGGDLPSWFPYKDFKPKR